MSAAHFPAIPAPVRRRSAPRPLAAVALLVTMLMTQPAHALYKVIGPDGKVTYTDRPPTTSSGERITPLNAAGNAPAADALPLELRQASTKYPVTLFVSTACEPCDAARTLLRQRGIPHTEKLVITAEDSDALLRLSGARTAPTLTVGAQALKGLSAEVWNSYLDSAGYPRESKLPANYSFAAATPLTERRDAARAAGPAARPAAPQAAPADAAPPPAGNIKF